MAIKVKIGDANVTFTCRQAWADNMGSNVYDAIIDKNIVFHEFNDFITTTDKYSPGNWGIVYYPNGSYEYKSGLITGNIGVLHDMDDYYNCPIVIKSMDECYGRANYEIEFKDKHYVNNKRQLWNKTMAKKQATL